MDKPVERFERIARDARKTYSPPRLTEYGHVEKLTLTGGHTVHDAHGSNFKLAP